MYSIFYSGTVKGFFFFEWGKVMLKLIHFKNTFYYLIKLINYEIEAADLKTSSNKNIVKFQKKYPETKVFRLETETFGDRKNSKLKNTKRLKIQTLN